VHGVHFRVQPAPDAFIPPAARVCDLMLVGGSFHAAAAFSFLQYSKKRKSPEGLSFERTDSR
jgi:hypothetical protein